MVTNLSPTLFRQLDEIATMENRVEELPNELSDDIMALKRDLELLQKERRSDQHSLHVLKKKHAQTEKQLAAMEELIKEPWQLLAGRIDNLSVQVSATEDRLSSIQQASGEKKDVSLLIEGIKSYHERIDSILRDLTDRFERSQRLEVHATKVSCHCTHVGINENMEKLRNRVKQVG